MARVLQRFVSDQRVLFLLVGAINTAVGYLLFVVLFLLLGSYLPYLVVLVVTYIVSSVPAFLLQRMVVFRVCGRWLLDLFRFQMVGLGVLGTNAALLVIGVELLSWPVLLSQAIATIVAVVLSYLGHRFISFARPRASATDTDTQDLGARVPRRPADGRR
jgi:putative flippase GtrA